MHDPRMPPAEAHAFNVVGTQKMLDLCVRQGVKKVVVLSSANVYGPLPGNTNFLPEETPLMASARFPDVGDLIEVDMYAQSFMWQHPDIETVILRPVNIVGPTVRNAPSNFLRLERPLTVLGFDPMVQLIHEEDACRALRLALRPGARGVYNVVGPGEAPLSAVLRELGRRPVPIPHFLIRPLIRQLFEPGSPASPPARWTTSSTCAPWTAPAPSGTWGGRRASRCGDHPQRPRELTAPAGAPGSRLSRPRLARRRVSRVPRCRRPGLASGGWSSLAIRYPGRASRGARGGSQASVAHPGGARFVGAPRRLLAAPHGLRPARIQRAQDLAAEAASGETGPPSI